MWKSETKALLLVQLRVCKRVLVVDAIVKSFNINVLFHTY